MRETMHGDILYIQLPYYEVVNLIIVWINFKFL